MIRRIAIAILAVALRGIAGLLLLARRPVIASIERPIAQSEPDRCEIRSRISCTFDVQRVNQNVALAPRSGPNDLDTELARLIMLSEMTVLWCRFFSRRRPESWGMLFRIRMAKVSR